LLIFFLLLAFLDAHTLFFFVAVFAYQPVALGAFHLARWTNEIGAGAAFFYAAATRAFIASSAKRHALITEVFLARGAPVAVIGAHGVAAVVTGPALPIGQGHVRRTGVVGGQHRRHQLEKVTDPSVGQGRFNGRAGIPFTKMLVADVRMGDSVVAGGWMGIEGHDPVDGTVLPHLGQAADAKLYLELTEIIALQLDGVSNDDQKLTVCDVFELLELILDLLKVRQDVPDGRGFQLGRFNHPLDLAGVVWQVVKDAHDAVSHFASRGIPVTAKTDGQQVAGAAQLILVLDQAMRPPDHLPEAAALKKPKLPVNLLRKAEQIALI
jgi:hypothetical protein